MEIPTVDIVIKNNRAFFNGWYPRDLVDEALSAEVPGARFSPAFRAKKWDGRTHLLSRVSNTFPPGVLHIVKDLLADAGYSVSVTNVDIALLKEFVPEEVASLWDIGFPMVPSVGSVVFRDYQIEAGEAFLTPSSEAPYRGILHMGTGCHAKGQGILLYDGTIVPVENICVGDLLMGPDSTPREVKKLIRGRGQMYKVVPNKGAPFEINEDHILTLKKVNQGGSSPSKQGGVIIDVSVKDYITWSNKQKHLYKLFRVPVEMGSDSLPIPSYLLGLLLGDGHIGKYSLSLTSADPEVYNYFISAVSSMGHKIKVQAQKDNASSVFHVTGSPTINLRYLLKDLGLFNVRSETKFVPAIYKRSRLDQRKDLLAGLIDTDGSYCNGGYDYISKSFVLASDVAFLARSVGLAAYVTPCFKRCQTGKEGIYYRVSISGDCSIIPCKIYRKISKNRRQKKDVLVTGFTLEKLKHGNFYGFTLNKDGRYLLDDFTVTHNSGKTYTSAGIVAALNKYGRIPTLFLVHGRSLVKQTYDVYVKCFGEDLVGICSADKWEPKLITIASVDTIASRLKSEKKDKSSTAANDLLDSILFIIADECHRATSKGWVDILKASAAPFRLGLSGTPLKNEDDRDLLLQSVTGPIVFRLETSRLQEEGHVAEADLITVAITQPELKQLDWHSAFNALIVENQDRTSIIADMAVKYAVEGKTILILAGNSVQFSKNIYESVREIISSFSLGVTCKLVTGTTKTDEVNAAFQELREKHLNILITTLLADEGIDVPAINVLMTVGGGKSFVKVIQRVGRGLRLKADGSSLLVIDFFDMTNKYLLKHAKERLKYYSEEKIFKSGTTIADSAYQMEYQVA